MLHNFGKKLHDSRFIAMRKLDCKALKLFESLHLLGAKKLVLALQLAC